MPLLRHVAYALGPDTLRKTRIALTARGRLPPPPDRHRGHPRRRVLPRDPRRPLHPRRAATRSPPSRPTCSTARSARPSGQVVFLGRDGRAVGVPGDALRPAGDGAARGAGVGARSRALSEGLTAALATELPEVFLGGAGIRPLRDVPSAAELEKAARPSPRRAARPRST